MQREQQQKQQERQRKQLLQQVRVQVQALPREPVQVRELLLFCRKQRGQQQRSQRSEREIYSFVYLIKKFRN
jgi:hypothetical protein